MEPIRSGNRHTIEIALNSEKPSKEQIAVYAILIRSLRDISGECVVFQFDKYLEYYPELEFLRFCKSGNRVHVEIRTYTDDQKLYANKMMMEDVIDLLNDCLCGLLPDFSEWKDITKRGTSKSW